MGLVLPFQQRSPGLDRHKEEARFQPGAFIFLLRQVPQVTTLQQLTRSNATGVEQNRSPDQR